MKRFAVILIIAVLAIGCVFAATGDSKNTESNLVTSGDKVIVTTDIDVIYPVYMINASNGNDNKDAAASSVPEIAARKVYNESNELTNVQIDISLRHFGYQNNEVNDSKKTYIRYAKTVTVTIEAGKLENKSSDDANHKQESAAPTVATNGGNLDTKDFKSTNSPSGNKVEVKAEYLTGKKVGNATFDQVISTCTFDWDVEDLTAGDTYQADVVVTYTNV